MEDLSKAISGPPIKPQQPQNRPSETFSVDGEDVLDPGSLLHSILSQSNAQPGRRSVAVPNQANFGTHGLPDLEQSSNQPGMSSLGVPNLTNFGTYGLQDLHQSSNQPGLSSLFGTPGLQVSDPVSLLYLYWSQSSNQAGTSSGVVPNETYTAQAPPHPNTSKASALKGNVNRERKRKNDQAYRKRVKKNKEDMQLNLLALSKENESLKKQKESIEKYYALTHQTSRDQAKEIVQLRSDVFQLKNVCDKQNVLVQALSRRFVENEKQEDVSASLGKNANSSSDITLAEENGKLKSKIKVLEVQNDALCEKIIRMERSLKQNEKYE
ncbi:hypothetical protein DITRI_Ditri06bG0009100 [Diplodiscus trichospermus]